MPILFFWVVAGVVSVAEAAVIVAALRMRVATDPARGPLGTRAAEVAWTLLPLGLLVALVALSYQAKTG